MRALQQHCGSGSSGSSVNAMQALHCSVPPAGLLRARQLSHLSASTSSPDAAPPRVRSPIATVDKLTHFGWVRACMRACVHACVCACVRACELRTRWCVEKYALAQGQSVCASRAKAWTCTHASAHARGCFAVKSPMHRAGLHTRPCLHWGPIRSSRCCTSHTSQHTLQLCHGLPDKVRAGGAAGQRHVWHGVRRGAEEHRGEVGCWCCCVWG